MSAISTVWCRSAHRHLSLAFCSEWDEAVAGRAPFAIFFSWRQITPNCFLLWASRASGKTDLSNVLNLCRSPLISTRNKSWL